MLGKFAHEVEEQLSIQELNEWVAFTRLEEKEYERIKSRNKAKR